MVTSEQNTVSVVVVDDDHHICRSMSRFLERSGYSVSVFFDGQAALTHALDHMPDVLLIDHIMPGISGTKVIENLADRGLPTACVLFTGTDDKEIVRRAFVAGAVDVLFKPLSRQQIKLAVDSAAVQTRQEMERCRSMRQLRNALDRLAHSSVMPDVAAETSADFVIRLGDLLVDRKKRLVVCDGKQCDLTPLEYRVMLHMAQHLNRVVTHQALAEAARGRHHMKWEAQEFTKQHIRNIRRKIGDNAQSPRFIHSIHSQGYRLALL